MSALDGMDTTLRAVVCTAKERGMSLSRSFMAVNNGKCYPTTFRSAKLIPTVFSKDKDNGVFSNKKTKTTYNGDEPYYNSDSKEASPPGNGKKNESEEGSDENCEYIKAITTPARTKRKNLNYILSSSTSSKSKNMYL